MDNKKQHGGPNRGQGRKPKPSEKYVDIHLKVPPRLAEWLKLNRARTGKAVNAFIVEAIAEKIETESQR